MKRKTLHMVGNAHIDPVWLWCWPEGLHEVKASFRSALARMNEYPDFVFVSSSAVFYEWIERSDPEMFAEMRRRIREGRWEIVGGWWLQPDCNIPGGEAFVRQGLYGQRYFLEKFGRSASVGYNVDSFGHHGMLPQILRKSGLENYVFLRPSPYEKGLPGRVFWWESDDGSRVLTYRIPYTYGPGPEDLQTHVLRCAAEIREPFSALMCFYGVGNHGGGPTRANIESIAAMNADNSFPSLLFSTPDRFFTDIRGAGLPLPVVHDDLQHHAVGAYSAHSGIKRWNRRAENALVTAEKFAALAACLTRQPYPIEELTHAWKNVLFNQFHDILGGTSIESAYRDARDMYGEARAAAARALNYALQSLTWSIQIAPEKGGLPLVVFNPHAWTSNTPVELETGPLPEGAALVDEGDNAVAFQLLQPEAAVEGRARLGFLAELPPLGYRTYRIVPAAARAAGEPIEADDRSMDNGRFRLELDPQTGAIASLRDEARGIEIFSGAAARAVVVEDPSDTWAHGCFRFDEAAGVFAPVSMTCTERGPVRAVIRVESAFGRSALTQDFIMYRGLDHVEVRVSVDWHERFRLLKLRFPLNLVFYRAVYEIPYGNIERSAAGDEEPGQSWIDVSGCVRGSEEHYGLSLINDAKYGYDVNQNEIGLTVLRSPISAHHIPVQPDAAARYAYLDQGLQRFTYSLLPHAGSWEKAATIRLAAELNAPAIPRIAALNASGRLPQAASFVRAEPENIVVSVIKRAEDGDDLIVRAYETAKTAASARITLGFCGRTIEARFGPCEIKTFRVPVADSRPVTETDLIERPL